MSAEDADMIEKIGNGTQQAKRIGPGQDAQFKFKCEQTDTFVWGPPWPLVHRRKEE